MEITVNIVDTLFDSIPKGTVVANYVTEVDTVNFKMYSTVYSIDETNKAIVTTKKVDANNLEAIHFDAINWVTTDKATIDNVYPKVVSKYQNKFKKEGVIYKITKDYDLNNCVLTIPDNCTLQFEGGTITNGSIEGNNTLINNPTNNAIFNDIKLLGIYNCTEVISDWFKKSNIDDTTNLQSLMQLVSKGGKCTISDGDYLVSQPTSGDGLCINIPSNTHLIVNGNIKMATNNYIRYNILSAINKHHITIEGSGSIIGDSDTHQFIQGSTSEWGYGIRIKNSNNIEVRGLQIYNCIGDGICCGHISNVYIKDCTIYNCGRQGITLATTSSSIVKNCNIYGIRRTAPSACIDIEPDPQQGNSDNIVIKNCLFNDSAFGVSIFTPVGSTGKNIKIIGCTCTLTKDTDIAFTTNNSCDVIYENNIIEYTAASNNTASAFKLESSSDITIKDCFISFGFIYPIRTNKVDKLLISNLNSKALNACQLYYVNNLIVENSVFSNRTGRILDIESFNTVTVKNNIILLDGEGNYTPANNPILIKKNNDISHKGYKTNSTNRAINIDDTDDVIIDNNNLYKETITTTAFSIYCNNVNFASITSNNIGSGTGVALLNSKRITGNYNVSIQGTNVQTFYYIDSTCSNCNLYLYHDSFKRLLQVNEFGISNEDGTEYSKVRFVTSNISLNFANTIYKIVSDIDLQGEELTIPANCTLDFQGGSFSNGTIVGSNTKIKAGLNKIFDTNIILNGTWDVNEAYPEWFGYKTSNAIQLCLDYFPVTKLTNSTYICDTAININTSRKILTGEGNNTILDFSTCDSDICVNISAYRSVLQNLVIQTNTIKENQTGISFVYSTENGRIENVILQGFYNGMIVNKTWYSVINNIRIRDISPNGFGLLVGDISGTTTEEVNSVSFNKIWIEGGKNSVKFNHVALGSVIFDSCTFERNQETALISEAQVKGAISFKNCYFEKNYLSEARTTESVILWYKGINASFLSPMYISNSVSFATDKIIDYTPNGINASKFNRRRYYNENFLQADFNSLDEQTISLRPIYSSFDVSVGSKKKFVTIVLAQDIYYSAYIRVDLIVRVKRPTSELQGVISYNVYR